MPEGDALQFRLFLAYQISYLHRFRRIGLFLINVIHHLFLQAADIIQENTGLVGMILPEPVIPMNLVVGEVKLFLEKHSAILSRRAIRRRAARATGAAEP